MSAAGDLKRGLRRAARPLQAAAARLREASPRPNRFAGAYPDRETALAALPPHQRAGYDDPGAVEISRAEMTRIALADWPVIHFLSRWLTPGAQVLDAGGHLGTKRVAFEAVLDLSHTGWTVLDLPAICAAGTRMVADGRLPAGLGFVTDPADAPAPDILLASGLLQYLDRPFAELVAALPARPRAILLNKVALRDGPEVVTLERIGPARVPYRMRDAAAFRRELDSLGYRQVAAWEIPELAHVIPTHPGLGPSRSCGFALLDDASPATVSGEARD